MDINKTTLTHAGLARLNADWRRVYDDMTANTPKGDIGHAFQKRLERIEAKIQALRKASRK